MKKFGTREEVINSLSKQTRGGLTKRFLKYNAEGKIISVRRRKQRGGGGDIQKILKYIINGATYYFIGEDITYNRYLQMIMEVNKDYSVEGVVSYIFDDKTKGLQIIPRNSYIIYKSRPDHKQYIPPKLVFLTNILKCNDLDPVIESIFDFECEKIDITEPSDQSFYSINHDKCTPHKEIDQLYTDLQEEKQRIASALLQLVKGGNPSSIHTGKRGGRFVMVGGRRRYLRK